MEDSGKKQLGDEVERAGERSGGEMRPMGFRTILPVIRAAGLAHCTVVFAVLFVAASAIVAVVEPAIGGFRDGAWFMYEIVTTVGLGDYTCVTPIGRACAIVLSLFAVFYLALVTGAVVNYCSERMKYRRDESVAHFIDQLEHLPELSHEELVEISEKVKRM